MDKDFTTGGILMDLQKLEQALYNIFGSQNVKPYNKGFRVIVDYENMPYCIILRFEHDRLIMDRDAVDEGETNYEEAYKKAYKLLIQNKDILGDIDI